MDSTTSLHHQETLESILASAKPQPEKKPRPADQEALNCPRCDSTNTKFCYYNNYSLSQPRYFCKSCRRYWTKGGNLRNVPVGGGYRKNKRVSGGSSGRRSQDHQITAAMEAPIGMNHMMPCFPNNQYDQNNDFMVLGSGFSKQVEGDFGFWGNPNLGDFGVWGNQNFPLGDVALGMNMNMNYSSGVFEHSNMVYGEVPGNQGIGIPFETANLQR